MRTADPTPLPPLPNRDLIEESWARRACGDWKQAATGWLALLAGLAVNAFALIWNAGWANLVLTAALLVLIGVGVKLAVPVKQRNEARLDLAGYVALWDSITLKPVEYQRGVLTCRIGNTGEDIHALLNVLVPDGLGLKLQRVKPDGTRIAGDIDTINDDDVRPDGGRVIRWIENDLPLRGGGTVSQLRFTVGDTSDPFNVKLSVNAAAVGERNWLLSF